MNLSTLIHTNTQIYLQDEHTPTFGLLLLIIDIHCQALLPLSPPILIVVQQKVHVLFLFLDLHQRYLCLL